MNENFVASDLSIPSIIEVEIVEPDLDKPGSKDHQIENKRHPNKSKKKNLLEQIWRHYEKQTRLFFHSPWGQYENWRA